MQSIDYFKDTEAFQIIVQTNLSCNIRCKHCYEADGNYPTQIMSFSVLEKIISLAQKQYKKISYLWFGGEPLIAGIDFYKKVIELQEKYNSENEIKNSIQTNGILLNKDFIEFFKSNNFKVSISYDAQYNNVLREKTESVEKNIKLCKENELPIATLSTISKDISSKQKEMYDFLREQKLSAKFNRIFPEGNGKANQEYLINDEKYLEDMKKFFILWLYDNKAGAFSTFDIYLSALFGLKHRECIFSGCLFKWLAVAPDGTVFPCPRFGNSGYSLGNIKDIENIYDVFYSEKYAELLSKNVKRRKNCKENCKWYPFCNGGCNARCFWNNDVENENTEICRFVKEFYPFVVREIKEIFDNDNVGKINFYMQELIEKYREHFMATIKYCQENKLI